MEITEASPVRRLLFAADPERLSARWRTSTEPHLRARRGIIALAFTSAATMTLIALYQVGVIRHLPDPPLPRFDADLVHASGQGYEKLATPDALLGLASYSVTAALAGAGGIRRGRALPLLLLGKVLFDAAQALQLTWLQAARLRKFGAWGLVATAATLATVPLALPEAREALRGRRRSA